MSEITKSNGNTDRKTVLAPPPAKRTRTTRPASVRSIGMRIADLLEKLPHEQRAAALSVASVLLSADQAQLPAVG